jgi:spermidine synthase
MAVVVPSDAEGSTAPLRSFPVGPRLARAVLLLATFVCAACGLVYELALLTLGTYLVGDTVRQASLVLSVFVFAIGCCFRS